VHKKRLVLDKDFTYGLIYRAYSDGYAEPYSQSSLQSSYSQNVLMIGSRPEIKQKLLPSLLLYESIDIEPFDNFILYSFNRKRIYPPRSETEQSIIAVQESMPRYMGSDGVKKYLDSIPPEMIVDLIHEYVLQQANVNIRKNTIIKALKKEIPKSYDRLVLRRYELYNRLHEPKLAPLLSRLLGLPYKAKLLDKATKNKITRELKAIEARLRIYDPIVSAYTYITQKLIYCESVDAHLLSTFLPANPTALRKGNVRRVASDKGDEWSALIGVVFNNMPWIRPRTYDELLHLSENKNIQEFRDFFYNSLEDVREGRTTLEKVAERARNAANVVKRIRSAEKFAHITAWISIPIEILSSLLPLTASYILSLALASPELYSYVERRKYRWALIDVATRS